MCKDEKISVKTSIFTDSIIKSLRKIQTLNILWQQKATSVLDFLCVSRDKALKYLRKGCKKLKVLALLYCKGVNK